MKKRATRVRKCHLCAQGCEILKDALVSLYIKSWNQERLCDLHDP